MLKTSTATSPPREGEFTGTIGITLWGEEINRLENKTLVKIPDLAENGIHMSVMIHSECMHDTKRVVFGRKRQAES